MSSSFKISLKWKLKNNFTYEEYSRNHEIFLTGDQIVQNSASPEYYGDETKTNPEELLASALSSCHMMTFLAICAKTKLKVISYEDDAIAILDKNSEGKMAVTQIILHPKTVFEGEAPIEDKLKDLHQKAHKNCFIAQSIKCTVDVVLN